MASRPATFSASVAPVLVGTAAATAAGHFHIGVLIAALLSSLFIQMGTNYTNDLYDFYRGTDGAHRVEPLRVSNTGTINPRSLAICARLMFGLAILVGLYLVYLGGWSILLIGLASIASGVLYTAGPWPLGYHGLGDLFVFIFFGPVGVVGTFYLHTDYVHPLAFVIALPVAFLVTAILVINNLRDINTDPLTGKITLAVKIGRRATRWEYTVLLLAPYLVLLLLWWLGVCDYPILWPFLTLPWSISLLRKVLHQADGPALNNILTNTSKLHFLFSILFVIALILS
jgi:1,4-dihydroxy-2-naphthoate octaprenyltransferase